MLFFKWWFKWFIAFTKTSFCHCSYWPVMSTTLPFKRSQRFLFLMKTSLKNILWKHFIFLNATIWKHPDFLNALISDFLLLASPGSGWHLCCIGSSGFCTCARHAEKHCSNEIKKCQLRERCFSGNPSYMAFAHLMHSEIIQAAVNKVLCCHVSFLFVCLLFFVSTNANIESFIEWFMNVCISIILLSASQDWSNLKAIINSRHSLLTSLETAREDHCCFFHLTNNQISFLSVTCEADIQKRFTLWATQKKAEFPPSLQTGGKTPLASWVRHLLQQRFRAKSAVSLQGLQKDFLCLCVLHTPACTGLPQLSAAWLGAAVRQMVSRWMSCQAHPSQPEQLGSLCERGQAPVLREVITALILHDELWHPCRDCSVWPLEHFNQSNRLIQRFSYRATTPRNAGCIISHPGSVVVKPALGYPQRSLLWGTQNPGLGLPVLAGVGQASHYVLGGF